MSGLYGRIQSNNARSLALFLLFFGAAEVLTEVMLATLLAEDQWRSRASISAFAWLRAVVIASWSGRAWLFHFSGYACWFLVAWTFYRAVVSRSLELRRLERIQHPVAWNIAEATALAAGLPMPRLYLTESSGRNAFAFGLMPRDASIVLSRGLLTALSAVELEAVIAHELAHIRGRDIRLMAVATLCAGVLFRVAWVQIAMVVQPSPQWLFVPMFAARFFWGVLLLALWCCAAVGICVVMARLAISHAREYKADAEAVDMTGNPEALISALRKLEGAPDIPRADFAVGASMIVSPRPTLFSTHPSVADRVAALRALFPSTEGSTALGDRPLFSRLASAPVEERTVFGRRQPRTPLVDRARSWREYLAALRAIRPPKWVSHPYILLPAIAMNVAIDFAAGPHAKDLATGAPTSASSQAQTNGRPRLPEFQNPGQTLK